MSCSSFYIMQRRKLVITGAIVALAIAATLIGAQAVHLRCTELTGSDFISIPDATLSRGIARLFCYRGPSGERIRFLLARDSNGTVHGLFDACEQCYKYRKGYEISGKEVICRYCGNRYKAVELQRGEASCVPLHLDVAMSKGNVKIKVADLEKGRSLF
jgi:uncharacterized membrane protein